MKSKPDAIVAVIVENDRFLAIRRGPTVSEAGCWAPLTGKVEAGETQGSAVVREVLEEVGLEVEAIRKVWECTSASGAHRLHWWHARPIGGTLRLAPREVSDARWLTAGEFASLAKTLPGDRGFFRSVFPGLIERG